MALTWPTTFDILMPSIINATTTKILILKKTKNGEIRTMDLNATNSIKNT
jgi:hypothetical protein